MISILYAANAAVAAAPAPAAGTTAAAPDQMGQMVSGILPIVLIMVVFYFLIIAPQRKEQKKTQEMLKALKEGDKVVTSGGIVGVISGMSEKDDSVQMTVAGVTKLTVMRGYITKKIERPNENAGAPEQVKK